jgi:hypothetical protein
MKVCSEDKLTKKQVKAETVFEMNDVVKVLYKTIDGKRVHYQERVFFTTTKNLALFFCYSRRIIVLLHRLITEETNEESPEVGRRSGVDTHSAVPAVGRTALSSTRPKLGGRQGGCYCVGADRHADHRG